MPKTDDETGISATDAVAVDGALQPADGERDAAPVSEAPAAEVEAEAPPVPRDETAFSLDPATGQAVSSLKDWDHATKAMQALDRGEVDEAGYHHMLAAGPEAAEG